MDTPKVQPDRWVTAGKGRQAAKVYRFGYNMGVKSSQGQIVTADNGTTSGPVKHQDRAQSR